jgi:hypothetical protein
MTAHMTGPQHYGRAEELLTWVAGGHRAGGLADA